MKIKLSKIQWENMGRKAGWIKQSQVITDDGFADGGARYTDDEMDIMEKDDERKAKVQRIKAEIATMIDEVDENLLTNEGFQSRLNDAVQRLFMAKN